MFGSDGAGTTVSSGDEHGRGTIAFIAAVVCLIWYVAVAVVCTVGYVQM